MRDKFTVGQVITRFKDDLSKNRVLTYQQTRTLDALERCRTASLGGHVDACPSCGHMHISYNSCRNRHCPVCQGTQRERWIEARSSEVVSVKYFHVVFTLPDALNGLFLSSQKQKEMYSLLFKAAWQTIDKFARARGLQCGMTSLLHTWGSNLHLHPHLHCILPAGGLDEEGKWKILPGVNNDAPYLFPIKGMSKVFRAKFMAALTKRIPIDKSVRKKLFEKDWVVYCKQSMKTTDVIRYLGRYSHRIALTNRRIKDISDTHVTFEYKNYKKGGRMELLKLAGEEFLRRFCQHILPIGFVRIRHYGFLAPSNRQKLRSAQYQSAGQTTPLKQQKHSQDSTAQARRPNSYLCPRCGKDYMLCVSTFKASRPPPANLSGNTKP
jgi:hypothetical protein